MVSDSVVVAETKRFLRAVRQIASRIDFNPINASQICVLVLNAKSFVTVTMVHKHRRLVDKRFQGVIKVR